MNQLDIKAARNSQRYSRKELAARVLWTLGRLLFRLTPRPMFGLRRMILRIYGAKIGHAVNIYPSAIIYYPWNLEIGELSSIGEWALVYNLGKIRIGERATVSQRVHLCAGTHDYQGPGMELLKLPIEIGDESWICADAFVGPNVTIGRRAVVAAGSVVVKNVEGGAVVGGNPARFLKSRDS